MQLAGPDYPDSRTRPVTREKWYSAVTMNDRARDENHVVIIGAGPAGLTAAYQLDSWLYAPPS